MVIRFMKLILSVIIWSDVFSFELRILYIFFALFSSILKLQISLIFNNSCHLEFKSLFSNCFGKFKKFSTHPLFKERYKILDSNKNIDFVNYDKNLNKEFNFIKAKFMAYTNTNFINNLNVAFSINARELSYLYINDINYLSSYIGLKHWFDQSLWCQVRICLCHRASLCV